MDSKCPKCKGNRGREVRKKKGTYSHLFGSSTEWIRCDLCGGSGINPNYREKSCEYPGCWERLGYHKDAEHPPKYCKYHKEQVQRERQEQNRQRSERPRYEQRPRQDDKWREKPCPGLKGESGCSSRSTIRYRTDWNRIPDLCPNCIAKIKQRKAENEAKWREKPCKRSGCSNIVKYNIDWDHPPEYCKTCSEARIKVNRNDKGTLQATRKDGTLLFTFGRCTAPPDIRQGGDADRRREWAARGYYWAAIPGNPHETFILDRNPVVDGFLQIGSTMDVSYTSDMRRALAMMAHAIINS